MSILINTAHSKTLLESIKKEIDGGRIRDWSYDADGDFQYQGQYSGVAWLRAMQLEGKIKFTVLTSKNSVMASSTYAILHARWLEMLLEHFDEKFSDATISALPSMGDKVKDESG